MRRHLSSFLPAFLCVALFGATVFWLVLPETERAILAKKREMIRELSKSVLSLLASYQQQKQAGLLTHEVAQERALARVRAMRYGKDGKNYFWIMQLPSRSMLLHPYTTELEGQDLTNSTDSRGRKFFVDMITLL